MERWWIDLWRTPGHQIGLPKVNVRHNITDIYTCTCLNLTNRRYFYSYTGYPTFHQRSDYSSSSISRCYGNNRRNPTKFGLADPSPGKPNNCSSATKIFKNSKLSFVSQDLIKHPSNDIGLCLAIQLEDTNSLTLDD